MFGNEGARSNFHIEIVAPSEPGTPMFAALDFMEDPRAFWDRDQA
jgi:hypothetical protein